MPTSYGQDKSPWILTASGGQFHYLANDPDELHIPDMARALSRDCRYGGHLSDQFEDDIYSVAQHSVYVYRLLVLKGAPERVLPWAVAHDLPEGYWRDMMTPLKDVITEYRPLEDRTAETLRIKYGIPYDEEVESYVKWADMQLYFAERRHLLVPAFLDDVPVPEYHLDEIDPDFYLWRPKKARDELLATIEEAFQYNKTGAIKYANAS